MAQPRQQVSFFKSISAFGADKNLECLQAHIAVPRLLNIAERPAAQVANDSIGIADEKSCR